MSQPDALQPAPSGSSSASTFRSWLPWLKWTIALGIISWLCYQNRVQFSELLSGERPIRWIYLGLAFTLCSSAIILTFFRWYLLVVALDFPFTFRDAMRIGFMGYLCNYVAPGAIGGDAIKALMLAKEQQSRRAVAVATILLDRILGLQALLMVGAGASLLVPADIDHREKIVLSLWGGTIAGLLGLTVMLTPAAARSKPIVALTRLPKVGSIFADMLDAVALYQKRRGVVLLTVFTSVVGHFGIISSFFLCAVAIGGDSPIPDYVTHLFLIPVAEILGVFAPVPGGIGALEYLVKESYRFAGAAPEIGFLAVGTYRVTTILVAFVGAGVYLTQKKAISNLMSDSQGNASSSDHSDSSAPV